LSLLADARLFEPPPARRFGVGSMLLGKSLASTAPIELACPELPPLANRSPLLPGVANGLMPWESLRGVAACPCGSGGSWPCRGYYLVDAVCHGVAITLLLRFRLPSGGSKARRWTANRLGKLGWRVAAWLGSTCYTAWRFWPAERLAARICLVRWRLGRAPCPKQHRCLLIGACSSALLLFGCSGPWVACCRAAGGVGLGPEPVGFAFGNGFAGPSSSGLATSTWRADSAARFPRGAEACLPCHRQAEGVVSDRRCPPRHGAWLWFFAVAIGDQWPGGAPASGAGCSIPTGHLRLA